eukprot:TRINITY_DN4277_c0_g1_i21.p1 TRINITY_DN4277_c0_g1~~TRINITY_DN4277_c0_g1_i21.p1  ORF type:complete len:454 (-),score=43.59 TRINITY_DN4277_c0_g1_i21:275-1636(-)
MLHSQRFPDKQISALSGVGDASFARLREAGITSFDHVRSAAVLQNALGNVDKAGTVWNQIQDRNLHHLGVRILLDQGPSAGTYVMCVEFGKRAFQPYHLVVIFNGQLVSYKKVASGLVPIKARFNLAAFNANNASHDQIVAPCTLSLCVFPEKYCRCDLYRHFLMDGSGELLREITGELTPQEFEDYVCRKCRHRPHSQTTGAAKPPATTETERGPCKHTYPKCLAGQCAHPCCASNSLEGGEAPLDDMPLAPPKKRKAKILESLQQLRNPNPEIAASMSCDLTRKTGPHRVLESFQHATEFIQEERGASAKLNLSLRHDARIAATCTPTQPRLKSPFFEAGEDSRGPETAVASCPKKMSSGRQWGDRCTDKMNPSRGHLDPKPIVLEPPLPNSTCTLDACRPPDGDHVDKKRKANHEALLDEMVETPCFVPACTLSLVETINRHYSNFWRGL